MIFLKFFGREAAGGMGTEMMNQGDIVLRLVMDTRDHRGPSSDGRRLSDGETEARRFYALELAYKRQHRGRKVERPDRDPSPGNGNDMSLTNDFHGGRHWPQTHNL